MLNLETIGGIIIEVHLRFADQWPDLYGPGWIDAVVRLYETGIWDFVDGDRCGGYSAVLFGPSGERYRHPPRIFTEAIRRMPSISSVQITFHEDLAPKRHAMPPGGFAWLWSMALLLRLRFQRGRGYKIISWDTRPGPLASRGECRGSSMQKGRAQWFSALARKPPTVGNTV